MENPNYPDILGAITGGTRLNLDVIQCALAMRPHQIPAGHFAELILLLQNASDIDVDVTVSPILPDHDTDKRKGTFSAKNNRLLVGLRPAEVGYVVLPITTSPKTAVGSAYIAGISMDIKRMNKQHPQRIREAGGGGVFVLQDLPEKNRQAMLELRSLHFSIEPMGKKNHIQTTFDMLPPAVAGLKELKANWVSLWTMQDYADEYTIAHKVWGPAQNIIKKLTRENAFMPLLKATQTKFQACGYPLNPPEAIFITKMLTLLLEMGIVEPDPLNPQPVWPHWFTRLCRLLVQEPALENQLDPLLSHLLYADLAYDAIMYAFTMLSTVLKENFGTEDEIGRYADDIIDALEKSRPLDFARTYFPLVLGGLIVNARVTMPREQIRETVFILSKATDNRKKEWNEDNAFIFTMCEKLIERALDSA